MKTLLILYPLILFNVIFGLETWQARRHYDEEVKRNYRNYKLVRITPRSEENLDYLKDLFTAQSPYELDFWQPPTHIGGLVDVTVAPEDAEIFVKDLDSKQLDYIIAINDLEQAIKNERSPEIYGGHYEDVAEFRFDKYNTWSQIEEYLYKLKDDYSDLVTLVEIGKSHENRSILVVKAAGKNPITPEKASLWLDAGIHAREWIAPATALIILDKLVTGYKSDPEIQTFLDNIDFYILPVMNPDGYDYTHTKNRMWRKNRRPAQCKKNYFHTICCSGVDLNRNFDWFWASSGSSSDPCHETYHGPSAFSEPESKAVKEFLEKNPPKAFITLHSYSQLWLIPYGHRKRAYPQDYTTALRPLALRATKALNRMYGTKYAVGTGADLMYEASGASHDYAKGTLHVPYSYLVELRPKSTMFANGFLLPEREIKGTGEETWEAIKVISDEIIGQFVQPKIRPTDRPMPWRPLVTSTTILPSSTTTLLPPTTSISTSTPTTTTTTPTTTTSSTTTPTNTTPTTTLPTTTSPSTTTTITEPTTTTSEPTTTTEEPTTTPTTTSEPSTATSEPSTGYPTLISLTTTTETTTEKPFEWTSPIAPQRIIKRKDYGSYCKWWRIHNLCDKDRVKQLCALSCLPECKIR